MHAKRSPAGWLEDTEQGHDILVLLHALVSKALAPWKKKDSTLLEIDCGEGMFQPWFRENGFDCTGVESVFALRSAFAGRLGSSYQVDAGQARTLPYGDGTFERVWINLDRTDDAGELTQILMEARRVAVNGLAVFFWNSLSLGGKRLRSEFAPKCWNWWRVTREIRKTGTGRMTTYSALTTPWCSGCTTTVFGRINDMLNAPLRLPVGIGAVCVVCMDWGPARPLTARPLLGRRLSLEGGAVLSCQRADIQEECGETRPCAAKSTASERE